jgi:hypothetical protein
MQAFLQLLEQQQMRENEIRKTRKGQCGELGHEKRMAWSATPFPLMGGPVGKTRTQWFCKWCKADLGIEEK